MYGLLPMVGAKQMPYVANAARFTSSDPDGLFIAHDPTDSKTMTLSMWFRRASDTGVVNLFMNGTGAPLAERVLITINADETLLFRLRNASNVAVVATEPRTSTTIAAAGTWQHLYFAINTASAMDVYLDGAAVSWNVSPGAFSDTALDLSRDNWNFGISRDQSSIPLDGCLSDVWCSFTDYLDAATYLASFRDATTGKPKPLPTNGIVNGVTPDYWLTNSAATFHQDESGNSNDFTVIGALSACATSPSD